MKESGSSIMIDLKRAYESPSPEDGHRVLVDRIWPRGVSKDELKVERWDRDLAPSIDLRRCFGHDPARWPEFRERYQQELSQPAKQEVLVELAQVARHGRLTLIYSARDTVHNQALVVKEVLEERLSAKSTDDGGPEDSVWLDLDTLNVTLHLGREVK
jgi:uncharacterized protein YeaO (DUF488 family)